MSKIAHSLVCSLAAACVEFSALATCSEAVTVRAENCSFGAVQAALDSATDGDTLIIPAGNCTWTSTLWISKGITLRGSGQDATVLTAGNNNLVRVNINGGSFRITGIGFTTIPEDTNWLILLDGLFTSLRVDHCKFTNIPNRAFVVGYYTSNPDRPAVKALFDHITFRNNVSRPFMLLYGVDESWLAPDVLGSDNAVFVEDSDFAWEVGDDSNNDLLDGEHGARFVVRHNTITNGFIGWHDTGSTPQSRGTRLFEIYDNGFVCTKMDCGWRAIAFRGGTGVVYNNTIPIYPNGYENPSATQIYRVFRNGGKPWTTMCDNVTDRICSDFSSHCNGGDYRACEGNYECVGVGDGTCSIDACTQNNQCGSGNTCIEKFDGQLDAFGWPCRDQTGRGQDDPVTHVQAGSPVYWWNNRDLANSQLSLYVRDVNYIKPNRDYYDYTVAFNGSTGMGMGSASARPTTCTPEVAYWATDENILYKCTTVNTWSVHYTPYPYPHPLNTPDEPTGLRIAPTR